MQAKLKEDVSKLLPSVDKDFYNTPHAWESNPAPQKIKQDSRRETDAPKLAKQRRKQKTMRKGPGQNVHRSKSPTRISPTNIANSSKKSDEEMLPVQKIQTWNVKLKPMKDWAEDDSPIDYENFKPFG
jgi:hypothetical protein